MAPASPDEPIQRTVTVPVAAERAFAVFIDLPAWWPPEFSWSGDVLETLGIEPREGGFCFERGPNGFRCDWGRVLAWEPPARLVFSWQISPDRVPEPDPAKASEVEVRFFEEGPSATRVEVAHREFARHGESAQRYRTDLADQGWPYLLDRYAAAAGR